jgi:hypothetical protein
MTYWLKRIGGPVLGIVVAGCIVAGIEMIGHASGDSDVPFIAALVGYFAGALAGGTLAAWISDRPRIAIVCVTGLLTILALINLFAMPHPVWFAPVAAVLLLFAAALAVRMSGNWHAAS